MLDALKQALYARKIVAGAVKVRFHTLGYASLPGLFTWGNFGVIPSPNHANPRP